MRTSLRWTLLGPGAALLCPLFAQSLYVRLEDGKVRVTAPQLHFIAGQPLDRLRNGAPVAFAIQLSFSRNRTDAPERDLSRVRDINRFMVSYDIWAEKFSVVKLGHPRRSASQLSATAAESWCIGDMSLPASGFPKDRPLWARLEVRAEDSNGRDGDNDAPVSLTRLIDIFSRRVQGEQSRWVAEAGPLRLEDLTRVSK